MNGLDSILQRMEEDTQRDVDATLAQGQIDIKAQRDQDQAHARALAETLAGENLRDAKLQQERLTSVAQMESRKILLAEKQDLIASVFAQAEEALYRLPANDKIAMMSKKLSQAAPDGMGEVVFAQSEKETLGQAVVDKANQMLGNGQLTVSQEVRALRGGFILVGRQVEVNASFETLVRLERSGCASEVAKKLFTHQ